MTAVRAFRAELLRVRTTRTPLAFAAGAAVLVVVGVAAGILSVDRRELAAGSAHSVRIAFGAAGAGWLFVLALGVLASAGEYRHGTSAASFLAAPSRGGRLAGKMLAHALVGALFALGAGLLTVAVALPWLHHRGAPVGLGSRELWLVLGGSALTTALYGPIGVAVGSLLRNQVAGLLTVLAWGLVLEPVVLGLWPGVGRYLPNGAASGLSRGANSHLLSMGWGGALFCGYVLALAAACAVLDARRDVVTA